MSVTLVHSAKAVGRNEVPFGRDTLVVPSNIVLDGGRGLSTETGDLGIGLGSEPPVKICFADFCQTVTGSGIVTVDSL